MSISSLSLTGPIKAAVIVLTEDEKEIVNVLKKVKAKYSSYEIILSKRDAYKLK